jgi:hypothetical protein
MTTSRQSPEGKVRGEGDGDGEVVVDKDDERDAMHSCPKIKVTGRSLPTNAHALKISLLPS